MGAQIRFISGNPARTYEFHTEGRAQFGRSVTYEADAQAGVPRRARTTWTIEEWFTEPTFADNQARLDALNAALSAPEGTLEIVDENGRQIYKVSARPERNGLPVAWNQTISEVTVTFTSREELSSFGGAVFTVRAGLADQAGLAVCLPNPSGWRESARVDRYGTAVANRKETLVDIAASGRVFADPSLSEGDRRKWLDALKENILTASDAKEGTLAFLGNERVVRLERLDAEVHESDSLTWTLSCFYRRWPQGSYAEAEFEVGQRTDLEKNETSTHLRGRVRADTEEVARAKAEEIRKALGGTNLYESDVTAQRLDGKDSKSEPDGRSFVELSFYYLYKDTGNFVSYKLSVTTRKDIRAGLIYTTYSGSVTAPDTGTAMAKARELGYGNNGDRVAGGLLISSTETASDEQTDALGTATGGGVKPERFVGVQFSYEYVSKGTWQFAEVVREPVKETFGPWTISVSGYAVAQTEAGAIALARSFMEKGAVVLKTNREGSRQWQKDGTGLFVRVDFHYGYGLANGTSAMSYRVSVAKDYLARVLRTTWSGNAYGPSESAADNLINTLCNGNTDGWHERDEREAHFDQAPEGTIFTGKSFTLTRGDKLDAYGDSILEAEYTVERISQVDHAVITPIPFGTPHVQTGCGLTVGSVIVNGSVTALGQQAAENWGKALKPDEGYPEPDDERTQTLYYPLSGESVRAYRFHFTYKSLIA
jgi:hypothetical protein